MAAGWAGQWAAVEEGQARRHGRLSPDAKTGMTLKLGWKAWPRRGLGRHRQTVAWAQCQAHSHLPHLSGLPLSGFCGEDSSGFRRRGRRNDRATGRASIPYALWCIWWAGGEAWYLVVTAAVEQELETWFYLEETGRKEKPVPASAKAWQHWHGRHYPSPAAGRRRQALLSMPAACLPALEEHHGSLVPLSLERKEENGDRRETSPH